MFKITCLLCTYFLVIQLFAFVFQLANCHLNKPSFSYDNSNHSLLDASINSTKKVSVLGKCNKCKLIINSFTKLLKNVSAHQEITVTNLDSFNQIKKSLDFYEIWKILCFNIEFGSEDCRSFAEKNFQLISSWWKTTNQTPKNDKQQNIIFNELCIKVLQVCCPKGHYGQHCSPCNGYPEQICSNNGKCAGDGTRLGNGHCVCNQGYDGLNCERCSKAFFMNKTIHQLNGSIQCIPCHISCAQSCFENGPRGCHVCKKGYAWDSELGCNDIDECDPELKNPCPLNSFCINIEGSFQCYQCDHACDGCNGDGPDSCIKCAQDHVLKDGICLNPNPKSILPYASPTRFMTYFGLCLVTCIIFRHNILIASGIGLMVAMYIMASENSLNTDYGKTFDKWWKRVLHQSTS